MKLCWNAIVRNEEARIERCVNSLLPYVDCGVVVDTGSTDATTEIIQREFARAGKPVEIHSASFQNFSQARNVALQYARASKLDWDYLLLADADMELKGTLALNGQTGLAYDMLQIAGDVRYYNRRLLSRRANCWYVGVTHEYADIGADGRIDSAWFRDHADGANRPGKLARDVVLLEEALKTETNPGLIERYHFYLGQTFFDLKNWIMASTHYKKRVELGGWDEERWNAQLHYAHAVGNMGDDAGFLWAMLEAYEMRPQRAEALYDLAKFFRERGGANFRSLLFSEPGLSMLRPADSLFVNQFVYDAGLKEEFSICAYYDLARRERGAKVCNQLALKRDGPSSARSNLYWYFKPLSGYVPSFEPVQIPFAERDGYVAMNPSVAYHMGELFVLVRTVNYRIDAEGRYVSRTGDVASDGCPIIRTRNYFMHLSADLIVGDAKEIQPPTNWLKEPLFPLVRGFEDSRLFSWQGELWTLSTVRELTREGWCEQVLTRLIDTPDGGVSFDLILARLLLGNDRRHEKNWMPWVKEDGDLQFVYRLGTIVDRDNKLVAQHDTGLDIDRISGGSQLVEIPTFDLAPSQYLALVHESQFVPGTQRRFYMHRFVLFSTDGAPVALSDPFYFHDRQIEFAAGLALLGNKLIVSYGVRDEEAWLATMDLDEVMRFTTS